MIIKNFKLEQKKTKIFALHFFNNYSFEKFKMGGLNFLFVKYLFKIIELGLILLNC
jgi:hypothetical protein